MRDVLLALLGAICVVVGVAMLSVPAAFITVGVFAVVTAYVARYLEVSSEDS